MAGSDGRINIDTRLETGDIERDVRKVNRELGYIGSDMDRIGRNMYNEMDYTFDRMGRSSRQFYKGTSAEAQRMSAEMRSAYAMQRESMRGVRDEMIKVQYGYYQMAKSADQYKGSTADFMDEIYDMGKQHKKVTDSMIRDNTMLRMKFYQNVGSMLAKSTQSEKIAKNFDRMNNPLYKVNKGLLNVTDGMERVAKAGQPAALALQMLGPTANMKELRDMTQLITRGLMRYQSVLIAAGITSALVFASIAKAAKGPNVAEVLEKQNEALDEYHQRLKERTDEIATTWGLFENIQLDSTSPDKLMKNLQEQVTALSNWQSNLDELSKKGYYDGFIQNLRELGPEAAGQIASLNQMSDAELEKYVELWREKHNLASTAAERELQQLKEATLREVQLMQESLKPLGIAMYEFGQAWAVALGPFIDMMSIILAKIVDVGTAIGNFFGKIAENNPILSKMIFGFLSLVPAVTMLLAPLAIGVGLFAGMKAAFASTWMLIGPLVTGLASMMGTVLLVTAAIVGLSAGFYLLWTRSETFRSAVIAGWQAIQSAVMAVIEFFTPYVMQAYNAVALYISQKLSEMKAFWDQHGAQVIQALQNVWSIISTVIQAGLSVIMPVLRVGFELAKMIVVSAWQAIKNIIDGALKIIRGVIQVFTGLFTGDFSLLWQGVKQIFMGALQVLWGWINLYFIGKFLGPLRGFASSAKSILQAMWSFLKGLFTSSLNGIRAVYTGALNFVRNFTSSVTNGIMNIFSRIFRTITTVIRVAVHGWRTVITTILNSIKSFISSVLSRIGGIIDRLFNGFVNSVRSSMTSVKDKIVSGWNSAKSFLTNIDLFQVGKDIIKGLINGIGSMIGAVTKKIGEVAGNIKARITGEMDTHSPSRWMRDKIGKMIPAGVAVGIEGNTSELDKAVENMGRSVKVNTSGELAANASNGSGSVNNTQKTVHHETNDNRQWTITLDAKNLDEISKLTDFFGGLQQAVRKG
ncbi:tail length tape measure protein [Halobacillus sp. Cin3]|uniref:phage tail protein n=1 Tax=Halobacillus sp. Cin3 TaxID=2928441 RepID=UPI00248D594F|nr:tail length tape measure protein [Halobacillus sp. Cin3]